MVEIIFWVSFALIFYTYIGYPVHLYLQARLFPKPVAKANPGEFMPTVSVVVAARNEEKNIDKRIRNFLEQDYPSELLEIIIVSDDSKDSTDCIVNGHIQENSDSRQGPRIKLLIYGPGRGKPFALNKGVAAAQGEIILFADARQLFKSDVVKNLVANFQDPTVGCVSGELSFKEELDSEIQAEMGAYWRYEKMIRKAESRCGSMVGATGAIYAIRRVLYEDLPEETLLDDVLIPLRIVRKGYRTIFDGSAIAYDWVSKTTSQEWRRKVRTLAGNWQLLCIFPSVIFPVQSPLWFRFFWHKLGRLLVPFALVGTLLTAAIADSPFCLLVLVLQLTVYIFALIAFLVPVVKENRIVNICHVVTVMNLAAAAGFYYWISGQSKNVWRPRCE